MDTIKLTVGQDVMAMSRRAMLIAPDSLDMDRKWLQTGTRYFRWIELRPAGWTAGEILSVSYSDVDVQDATLHRYICPGWKIPLPFYVDDRLAGEGGIPVLPAGYVMPGWIVGQALEWWPL